MKKPIAASMNASMNISYAKKKGNTRTKTIILMCVCPHKGNNITNMLREIPKQYKRVSSPEPTYSAHLPGNNCHLK